MNVSNRRNETALWAMSYLIVLGLAVYLSRGLPTLHSPYLLIAIYAVLGLGLSFALKAMVKNADGEGWSAVAPFLVFALVQGGVGYAVARYAFNLPTLSSLAYPLGGVLAFFGYYLLRLHPLSVFAGWVIAGFYAGGLAVALRLGAIQGGLFFGIGLLNAYFLGKHALGEAPGIRWGFGLGFAGLLVAGRAALQIYLMESGYGSLGVVITHPYTFAALFAGLALPWMFREMEAEKCLPSLLSLLLLGVLLPWVLGIFIHVRPIGAYLMGLVFSSFVVGLVYSPSFNLALLAYLNLAAANVGLPWFRDLAKLSRWTRLEVLGGLLLVVLVIAFLSIRRREKAPA